MALLRGKGKLFAGALFAGALFAGQDQPAAQTQGTGGGAYPTIAEQVRPQRTVTRLVIPVENIEEEDEEQVVVFILTELYRRRLL